MPERFDTVELNASFYRLQSVSTYRAWASRLPPKFVMAVKASRYLTHTKRPREPGEPLARLWGRVEALGPHLGPVLYQLPPRWGFNPERLAAFLAALPSGRSQAIEFRDRSWDRAEARVLLAGAGVALCLHDMPGSNPEPTPTGPFVYVRFHGAGQRYGGRYRLDTLQAWAGRLDVWARQGLSSWVYFNNDIEGHAPRDAVRLRELVTR